MATRKETPEQREKRLARQREHNKRYYAKNAEKMRQRTRDYYAKNREARIAYAVELKRKKRAEDPEGVRAKERAYMKEYYVENRDVLLARTTAYNRRPEVQKRDRERRKANREQEREKQRRWKAANPDRVRAYRTLDQARRKGAFKDPLAKDYISEVLISDPCSYCGGSMEQIDHIEPVRISRDSTWENLTASCESCNKSKQDRPLLYWLLVRN